MVFVVSYLNFFKKLGWGHLLNQHYETPNDDLYTLFPEMPDYREFQLTHTEDKLFIMEEIHSWLSDHPIIPNDHN